MDSPIHIRKFCSCAAKLECVAQNEEHARQLVELFRLAHSGYGHSPANAKQYANALKRKIAAAARQRRRSLPLFEQAYAPRRSHVSS
jgi:hypothetical protein